MKLTIAVLELAATVADAYRSGDLLGHLRAWWATVHGNADAVIDLVPAR